MTESSLCPVNRDSDNLLIWFRHRWQYTEYLCRSCVIHTEYRHKSSVVHREGFLSFTTLRGVTYSIPLGGIGEIEINPDGVIILQMDFDHYEKYSKVMLDKDSEGVYTH